MPDIGPKIGVDGEKQFRQDLQKITQSLKTLDSEMKVVASSFDGGTKSANQLKAENDVLERSVLTLRDKLKLQQDILAKSAQKYGEADEKTMKWHQEVNKTTAALNNAERQIRENTAAIENLGKETETASEKSSVFGDTFKGVFSADLLMKGLEVGVDLIKKAGKAIIDTTIETAAWADDINTLAAITGLTTQQLQEFQYMSELVDVDVDTLTGSMSKLTKNMNTARKGTGDAATAFGNLGISITDDAGELRNNKEVFFEVITALSEMTNETERDAAAMAIFGKSAQDLNPLIKAGADEISNFAEEANNMGLVYSDEELDKLNNFNDDFYRLKTQFEGLKTDTALIFIDEFGGKVSDATDYVKNLREQISEDGLGAAIKTIAWDFSSAAGTASAFATAIQNIIDKINIFKNASPEGLGGGTRASILENNYRLSVGNAANGKNVTVNVNTQHLSQSEYDYVINSANTVIGGLV